MFDFTDSNELLTDKIILVTGATSGLGKACAVDFAARGATVILLGRNVTALEQVYDEIEQAGYPQPAIYPMNLEGASEKDYDDLAANIDEAFGRLDGLLHNAAWLGSLTPVQHFDTEIWYRVMQVNLNAPFLLTRSCLGLLNAADNASLLFVSDSVGRKGKAYWGAYGASKAALENLMQTLADELEVNTSIRVNSIDPGPMQTKLRRNAYPAEDASIHPRPEDITHPFIYLMSDLGKDIHNQQLTIQNRDK
jgi:NAD(P)-dependent dehydrogenase (short-subunit alcohol dehydrogenase family)